MTEREKQRALERAQRERLRAQIALLRNTQTEIHRLLTLARASVRETLLGQPSDYERWQLPQIEREISRALQGWRAQATTTATGALERAWEGGKGLVDGPLEAAGFRIAGVAPLLTQNQLQALKSFLTDRLRDVSAEAVNRINAQLGLVVIGAQSPFDATKNVAALLEGHSRRRATSIVRTELGRAFSVASQERMNQVGRVIADPKSAVGRILSEAGLGQGLDKVWRRSGKAHQRVNHAIADGQRVAHDAHYEIIAKTGEIVRLMFPRDPKAPPGETINCGCVSVPKVRGWNSTTPDRVPFSDRELNANPELKKLLAAKASRK